MAETINAFDVPEHHVKMFTSNVMMDIQLKPRGLIQYVTRSSYTGEGAQAVNFIGTMDFDELEGRKADTKLSELAHTQRWIYPKDFTAATLVERIDQLRMIYDPTSPYVEAMAMGHGRRTDELIVNAFKGLGYSGKDGATSVSLPSDNIIDHGSTGLTVAKLRTARKTIKKLIKGDILEPIYIGVTADQVDDLLDETTVTSTDYNAIRPLVDGEVSRFMGFTFIPFEGWNSSVPASNVIRECPVWLQSGMHWGDWDSLSVSIDKRPDKNNLPQLFGRFSGNAVRIREEKVLIIECDEGAA